MHPVQKGSIYLMREFVFLVTLIDMLSFHGWYSLFKDVSELNEGLDTLLF